jgi:hypothetical protein
VQAGEQASYCPSRLTVAIASLALAASTVACTSRPPSLEPLRDGAARQDGTSAESTEPGDSLDAGCGPLDAGGCGWFCGYGFVATLCGTVGLLLEGGTDFAIAGGVGVDAGDPTQQGISGPPMSFQQPAGTAGNIYGYLTARPEPGTYANSKDDCDGYIVVSITSVPEAIVNRAEELECGPGSSPCEMAYIVKGGPGCEVRPNQIPNEGSWTLTLTDVGPYDVDAGASTVHGTLRAQLVGAFIGGVLPDAGSTTLFLPF